MKTNISISGPFVCSHNLLITMHENGDISISETGADREDIWNNIAEIGTDGAVLVFGNQPYIVEVTRDSE